MEIVGNGIIQYVSPKVVIISRGASLYRSYDSGESWEYWVSLPASIIDSWIGTSRWMTRMTRKKVHHLLRLDDEHFICFAYDNVFLINEKGDSIEDIGEIKGSRPLMACINDGYVFYGVYTSNKDRKPVPLLSYDLKTQEWQTYYTFNNIRHIHGVYTDPEESGLWVTTGDLDEESSIIKFDGSGIPEKIITGSQQCRAVDLLFTEKHIFYASDAPHEPNFIYRVDRENYKREKLQEVGGPIFWGRQEQDYLFFSTVVEPTDVNRTDAVELWSSLDGGDSWKVIAEFKKDIGHKILFQLGQIKFPKGPGDGKNLWITPYATEFDQKVARIPLETI